MERHPFDPLSFLAGAFFAVAGLAVLFGDGAFPFVHARWIWPVLLIATGVLLVLPRAALDRDVSPPMSPQPPVDASALEEIDEAVPPV
jgi:hypothetical protein